MDAVRGRHYDGEEGQVSIWCRRAGRSGIQGSFAQPCQQHFFACNLIPVSRAPFNPLFPPLCCTHSLHPQDSEAAAEDNSYVHPRPSRTRKVEGQQIRASTFLSFVACTWHCRLSRVLRLRTFSVTSTCSDLAVAGTQSTDAQWQAHRASVCTTNHMGVRRHLWFQRHDTTAHIWGACGHLTSSPSPRPDFSDGGQE